MIKISKTGRMSVVCDKCGKQHPSARGLSLVAEFDDKEYICSKCKRLLTKHAPDVVESAASVGISPTSEVSASQADSTSATTQVM